MHILRTEYAGVSVLIMDLVDPDEDLGRHAFDIRTILCPDGSIQVYSTNMLVNCEDYFSWSANYNCTLDLVKEECVGHTFYDGNQAKYNH